MDLPSPKRPARRWAPRQRRQIAESMRAAVWQMRSAADIAAVLEVMQAQLQQLGLVYQALGVNVIDPATKEVVARYRASSRPGGVGGVFQEERKPQVKKGAIVRFWKGGKAVYRPDLHRGDPYGERAWADLYPGQPVRCVVDVPFSHGTLALNSPLPDAFAPADIRLLREMAGVLSEGFRRLEDLKALERRAQEAEALALERAQYIEGLQQEIAGRRRAEEELRRRTEQLDLLVQISRESSTQLDLDALLDRVVRQVEILTPGANAITLYLYDPRQGLLVPRAWNHLVAEATDQIRLQPGESASGKVFQSGRSSLTRTPGEVAAFRGQVRPENERLIALVLSKVPVLSNICVPLRTAAGIIGTLTLTNGQRVFDEEDLALVEGLAGQVAQAIANAQLFAQVREFSQRLLRTQEEERRQVAQELHEGANQALAAVRFQLSAVEQRLADKQAAEQKAVAEARRTIEAVIREIRDLSVELRPGALEELGFLPAARSLCREFAERLGIEVSPEFAGFSGRLPAELETALYRILQEALHHVEKHAEASAVQVRLVQEGEEVVLEVRDNGKGSAASAAGLANMQERARLLGGEARSESIPGKGTILRVRVPVGG